MPLEIPINGKLFYVPMYNPNYRKAKMNEQKTQFLYAKYPVIFRDHDKPMTQTCMCWGFEHDGGWFELIDELCDGLTLLMDKYDFEVIADQVKEKFGGLSFYIHTKGGACMSKRNIIERALSNFMFKHKWGTLYRKIIYFRQRFYKTPYEKVRALIDEAARKSYITCEICGAEGKTRGGFWLKTLCDKCDKKEAGGFS